MKVVLVFLKTLQYNGGGIWPVLQTHRVLHEWRKHQARHLRLQPEDPREAGQVPSVE